MLGYEEQLTQCLAQNNRTQIPRHSALPYIPHAFSISVAQAIWTFSNKLSIQSKQNYASLKYANLAT